MATLKPITEVSSEELLKLIKDNPIEVSKYEHHNDCMEFLSVYGIKQGEHRILFNLIYRLYKKWSKTPVGKRSLADAMVLLFPTIKYGQSNVYLINKEKSFFLETGAKKKKQNKTKRKPWLKHFKLFIDKFELKSGRFYVKDVVLYNLYDKWTYKNNKHNPLGFQQFLKFCRLFFKNPTPKIIRGNQWFAVDSEVQKYFTPELIKLMEKK